MKIRVNNLTVPFQYLVSDIENALVRKYQWQRTALKKIEVVRRSLDARRGDLSFVLSLDLVVDSLASIANLKDVVVLQDQPLQIIKAVKKQKVVVVGAGPAGLMAAYLLAEAGAEPLLLERGEKVSERVLRVNDFWKKGNLNNESNVLFGEGGAGLFSDGKLNSRSKDRPRVRYLLETLVACGADYDILLEAEPHLGSDQLLCIIAALREKIKQKGGSIRFNSRLDKIEIKNNKVCGVYVGDEFIEAESLVLATGHSAHDIYQLLFKSNIAISSKAFAIGLRVEMPQAAVDKSQWGKWVGNELVPAANFRLTLKPEKKYRACYSFCMCPGGVVISCAAKAGELFTNGMSYSKRNTGFANAAFLVPVMPSDYQSYGNNALAGILFQQEIESLAYRSTGGTYHLPAMTLCDFLKKETSQNILVNRSWKQAQAYDLADLLPDFVTDTLKFAIPKMLKVLKFVNEKDVLLYGPESRSSSPVRIDRDQNGESISTKGLYPCGEGAGYAGGIVSSAVDGLRIAESILNNV